MNSTTNNDFRPEEAKLITDIFAERFGNAIDTELT